jgi:hypothetical protein
MQTWKSGSPPSIGWWPASTQASDGVFRWWDGRCWSLAAVSDLSSSEAGDQARRESVNSQYVLWTERPIEWPRRSLT